jgi:hypothetical protein
MTTNIKLPVSVSAFVGDVRRIAFRVRQHGARMSAATNGEISVRTADDLERLTDQLIQIHSERQRNAVGSAGPLISEGEKLITAIGLAGRFAGKTNPLIVQQLAQLRSGRKGRSAAAVKFALEMHLGLLEEHRRELGGLLPPTIVKDVADLIVQLDVHAAQMKLAREAEQRITAQRNEVVGRLLALVSHVRGLVAVLFRDDPAVRSAFAVRAVRRPPGAQTSVGMTRLQLSRSWSHAQSSTNGG